jgi:fumarate reductase subunit C
VRAWWAQTASELRLTLRNGEQLLVGIIIPLLVLVFFSLVAIVPLPEGVTARVDIVAPGVLALAVMSSAMVSLGIGTGFERQYGVLKRLGATPLGRGRWLAAKVASVLVLIAAQMAVLVPVALLLGWDPTGPVLALVPALLAGAAAFAGIGLLDSLHYRPALPDEPVAAASKAAAETRYAVELRSVLDLLLDPRPSQVETTYSAPLATRAGVLSSEMHSGSINSSISRAGSPAHRSATVVCCGLLK